METKPGMKTTEFWIAVIVSFIGFLASLGIFTPEQSGAVADAITKLGGLVTMVAGSFGYSISRGNAKRGIKPD